MWDSFPIIHSFMDVDKILPFSSTLRWHSLKVKGEVQTKKDLRPKRESLKRTISVNGGFRLLQMVSESAPDNTPKRKSPKRTISVSGGLETLQMVSKSGTGRCINLLVVPQRRWITWIGKKERVSLRGRVHYIDDKTNCRVIYKYNKKNFWDVERFKFKK